MVMGQDLRAMLETTIVHEAVHVVAVFFNAFRDLPTREANIACRAGPMLDDQAGLLPP